MTVLNGVAGVVSACDTVVTIGVVRGELAIADRITRVVSAAHAVVTVGVVGCRLAIGDWIAGVIGASHAVVTVGVVGCDWQSAVGSQVSSVQLTPSSQLAFAGVN